MSKNGIQKIRVLIFVHSLRIGGSERQAVELGKRFDRSMFDVVIACFRQDGPLARSLRAPAQSRRFRSTAS